MSKKRNSLDALDPFVEKVGQLTRLHQILICIVVFALLVGGFFYVSYLPKIKEIDKLTKNKAKIENQLATARKKAAQLAQLQEEMKKAEENFTLAKAVLPETKEIPSLLTSVSQAGQDAGLEFLSFLPKSEVSKDFYAEIPVDIIVSGSYHNVASFFDNVSRLYRIVNIKDIELKSGKSSTLLETSCTAVTYKFVEQEEDTTTQATTTSRRTRR